MTVNASNVSAQITRHERDSKIGKLVPTRSWRARQLVELALCANQRWATRVILRLGAPDKQGRRQHRDPTPGLPTHGDEP